MGIVLALISAWLLAGSALSQPDSASGQAAPPSARAFYTADELLRALESADRELRTLSADVIYDKEMVLEHDRQTRIGKLYFESTPGEAGAPAHRRFGIDFTTLILGDAVRDDRKIIVFDGEWLVEKVPAERQMIKRQVVPPGERFDPLRLGEGPFPIPIGQKREDILARYTAELLRPEAGLDRRREASAINHTKGTYQLRLVPKPEREDEDDFQEIRLWYDQTPDGRLLPKLARTVRDGGDVSLVILNAVRTNEPLPEGVLDTTNPPSGWDVRIVPWESPSGD